MVAGWLIDTGK